MAEYNRLKVEYIRAPFINGSSAMQLEIPQPKRIPREKKEHIAKPKHKRKYCFNIEPVSLVGAFAAKVLCTFLIFGFTEYLDAQKEYKALYNTLIETRNETEQAAAIFYEQIDLIQIEQMATSFGMVPISQAKRVPIVLTEPQKEEEETIIDEWLWHWNMLWADAPIIKFRDTNSGPNPPGPVPSLEDLI